MLRNVSFDISIARSKIALPLLFLLLYSFYRLLYVRWLASRRCIAIYRYVTWYNLIILLFFAFTVRTGRKCSFKEINSLPYYAWRTVSMLLLAMIIAGMMVLDAVWELVVRMCHVIMIVVTVLVFPSHLSSIAYHGSVEMLKRVRVTARVGSLVK